jgi:hypothetical protein
LKLSLVFATLVCVTAAAGAYVVWAEYSSFPPHFRGFGEVTRRHAYYRRPVEDALVLRLRVPPA